MVTASKQNSPASLHELLPDENPKDLLDPARLVVGGDQFTPGQVIRALTPHLTAERVERIERVVAGRVKSVAVVVEGLANTGNVSAVMRSAEALGFLEFHVVHRDVQYKTSKRTTQGAEKWLDVFRWDTPAACAEDLRRRGFRLIATHLGDARPISDFNFAAGRSALVFGNEREGLSQEMLELCDERMIIPISGFAQSFNISVAAAIALHHVRHQRESSLAEAGDLSAEERIALTADYLIRSSGAAESILRRSHHKTQRGDEADS